jgi:rSAM/selenodomain-associated transferase 1
MTALPRLCIFARAPVLGEVKTRLGKTIGEQGALAAHQQLVQLALSQLARVPGLDSQLWIAGSVDDPGVVRWSRQWQLPVFAQQGDDLGARMQHAVDACLADQSLALVVGTDCPAITAAYVSAAIGVLERCDLVLGPAEDGGYGLIGLRKPAPELFNDMQWGSDGVLARTLERASKNGLSYQMLETIWDVDEASDWFRFLRDQRVQPTGAMRTDADDRKRGT